MAPRRHRTLLHESDSDSTDENGVQVQSTIDTSDAAQREAAMKGIMMADLGSATRSLITETEMGRRQNVNLNLLYNTRDCNQVGTDAAKNAKQNKGQLAGWNNFVFTDDAKQANVEVLPDIAAGNTHRERMRLGLEGMKLEKGGKLTLDDVKFDRPRHTAVALPSMNNSGPVTRSQAARFQNPHGRGGGNAGHGKQDSYGADRYRPLDPAVQNEKDSKYSTGQYRVTKSKSKANSGASSQKGSPNLSVTAAQSHKKPVPGKGVPGRTPRQVRPWPPPALASNEAFMAQVNLKLNTSAQVAQQKEAGTKKASPKAASSKTASAQKASSQKGSPKMVSPKKASPKNEKARLAASPNDTSSKKAAKTASSPNNTPPKNASSKKGGTKTAASPTNASPKTASSKKGAAKKGTSSETAESSDSTTSSKKAAKKKKKSPKQAQAPAPTTESQAGKISNATTKSGNLSGKQQSLPPQSNAADPWFLDRGGFRPPAQSSGKLTDGLASSTDLSGISPAMTNEQDVMGLGISGMNGNTHSSTLVDIMSESASSCDDALVLQPSPRETMVAIPKSEFEVWRNINFFLKSGNRSGLEKYLDGIMPVVKDIKTPVESSNGPSIKMTKQVKQAGTVVGAPGPSKSVGSQTTPSLSQSKWAVPSTKTETQSQLENLTKSKVDIAPASAMSKGLEGAIEPAASPNAKTSKGKILVNPFAQAESLAKAASEAAKPYKLGATQNDLSSTVKQFTGSGSLMTMDPFASEAPSYIDSESYESKTLTTFGAPIEPKSSAQGVVNETGNLDDLTTGMSRLSTTGSGLNTSRFADSGYKPAEQRSSILQNMSPNQNNPRKITAQSSTKPDNLILGNAKAGLLESDAREFGEVFNTAEIRPKSTKKYLKPGAGYDRLMKELAEKKA